MRRLTICRHELDLQFNSNMFKLLLLPNIRMLGTIYRVCDTREKERVDIGVRKKFRMFCLLPWTAPNELVANLIGEVAKVMEGLAEAVEHKTICRRIGVRPNRDYILSLKTVIAVKHIPKQITRLIKLMYGEKCA
jgi:hypothetical protein